MQTYLIDAVGLIAAGFTTLCWVPQTVRILRTRDTRAISFATQLAFTCGVGLWFVYGLLIGSWPVMIANAVTLVLANAILALKIVYR